MTIAPKQEPTTELEKQLRAHLTLVEYFARKCLEGLATPLEALKAIRETAAPFIDPIQDDQVLVIPNDEQEKPPTVLTVDDVKREVTAHFGLPPRVLEGPGRHLSVARPRMVAMYLARKLTTMSFPQIGRSFGGRDHTTVMHAVEKVESLIREDLTTCDHVSTITDRLTNGRATGPCGHTDAEHAAGLGGQSCAVLAAASSHPPVETCFCLGCGARVTGSNDETCPYCSETVLTRRAFSRALRCDSPATACKDAEEVLRADGSCVCSTCDLEYRQHPHCARSAVPASMSSSTEPEYVLRVICGGLHVKL